MNFLIVSFSCLLLGCGIYFMLLAPLIFKFILIPRIENRFHDYIKIDSSSYGIVVFPSWGMPALEISTYIFCKYIGWDLPRIKNPREGRYYYALKKGNYNISEASKFEIVLSFITIFLMLCTVISGAIVGIFAN